MQTVLLIHGFNGIPKIFQYFKEELEKLNYNVIMPEFPAREEITIEGYFNILDNYKSYFNENLIVVAHSIGNPIFIKYISKNGLKVGKYISLDGFSRNFFNEGKDVLNEKVKQTVLSEKELKDARTNIGERYSLYSDSDYLVPFKLLEQYCKDINSVAIPMKDIGHIGKKSGLEKLPKVIELIDKSFSLKIRNANIKDLNRITEIEKICFPYSEAASKKSFEGRLKDYSNHFWVLEDEGKIVSFINGLVTDNEHLEDEMYSNSSMHNENGAWQMIFGVDTIPEYRGRGCAGLLIKNMIEMAKAENRKGLVLTCKDHLVKYYSKFGFIDEGISESNHGGVIWHEMRLTFSKGNTH